MKLASRIFRIKWHLHAWAGVVASLFFFVIFYCGVFALFHHELEVWQDPALHVAPSRGATLSFEALAGRVEADGAIHRGARVSFATHEGTRFVTASVSDPESENTRTLRIDPVTGATVPGRSRLADELYFMHFFYRVPGGMEFSGLLAVALLVALVSGLLIHLKDLRRQWWQFRPSLRLRFSSSDAHKVLGVFGLPFTAVFAWSGAVLCLSGLVGAGLARTNFGGDETQVAALHDTSQPTRTASGVGGTMLPLDTLEDRARGAIPGAVGAPRYLDVQLYGDRSAWARVYFHDDPLGARRHAFVDAVSGDVLGSSAAPSMPAAAFEKVLFDLHFAEYGGLLLKALYALLTLAACAVIVTGNLVWLERRDATRAQLGNRILERLTVGVAGGLVFASAAYFAVNRTMPLGLEDRADWEFYSFLAVWALAVTAAFVPRFAPKPQVAALGAGAAVLFLSVMATDVMRLDVNAFTALRHGLPSVAIANALLLGLAVLSGGIAWALRTSMRVRSRASPPSESETDDP